MTKPKVLLLDIETSPIISYTWGLFDQNIGLNQIKEDWHLLSWSAKWLDEPASKIMYADQRSARNIKDDTNLLRGIWKLIDKADILITQNGVAFDMKKLNARFIQKGFKPASSVKHIDTLKIARKVFGFTSNKLEYLTDKLCVKYKKSKHQKFPGFELWVECLKGNPQAWEEMEKYNKQDVLSLEEIYHKLVVWDKSINFNLYHNETTNECKCGSTEFQRNGFSYTSTSKFQRYRCVKCGSETRDRKNLLTKDKRDSLKV
jgi:hypothetical protein